MKVNRFLLIIPVIFLLASFFIIPNFVNAQFSDAGNFSNAIIDNLKNSIAEIFQAINQLQLELNKMLASSGPTICGDSIMQRPNSRGIFEVCDSLFLGGKSCSSFGFLSGILKCSNNCLTFDASSCLKSQNQKENRPPVLSPIGSKTFINNQFSYFSVSASDPDRNALYYSINGQPQGSSFYYPWFSWKPAQLGIYNVIFTVSDGLLADSETAVITVKNPNQPPVLGAIGNKAVPKGQLLTFSLSAADPENDVLTYSAAGLPLGASFNTLTKTFSWTPNYSQLGNYYVSFTVSDGKLFDYETIIIAVQNVCLPVTCQALGRNCGSQLNGCGGTLNCGTCNTGYSCNSAGQCIASSVQTTNNISQYGITWTFDKAYPFGQFANGDYWVVGSVKIISINPPSLNIGGVIKNGAMINPAADNSRQGYDNRITAFGIPIYFNNAARPNNNDLSSSNPLILQQGSSLMSAISLDAAQNVNYLKTAAVLTVLSSPAPKGSFRPAYSGTDKTIKFNKSDLNYALLGKVAPPAGAPSLTEIERNFERPWLDTMYDGAGRGIHPVDNMPDYGREISLQIGDGALMLNLNFTDAQKEKLLIEYTQLGIDLHGISKIGDGQWVWSNNGGQSSGRKWPILFAGLILNNSEMKNIAQKSGDYIYSNGHGPGNAPSDYVYFAEDDQTFYVNQADIDVTHSAKWNPDSRDSVKTPYANNNLGLPEWGIVHATNPEQSNAWFGTEYRECCTTISWAGFAMAAQIMGVKDLWNHDAMFDYTDRYMEVEKNFGSVWGAGNSRQWSALATNMWDAYRNNYGCAWTRDNSSNAYSAGHYNCAGQSVRCSWQNSTVGILATSCSQYPNQRAINYDPCNLNCAK